MLDTVSVVATDAAGLGEVPRSAWGIGVVTNSGYPLPIKLAACLAPRLYGSARAVKVVRPRSPDATTVTALAAPRVGA